MVRFQVREWNLRELVKNPKSSEFTRQLKVIEKKVRGFEQYKGQLKPSISEQRFTKILHSLEDIIEKVSVVGGYASLSYAVNTQSDDHLITY